MTVVYGMFLACYGIVLLTVALYGLHRYHLVWLYRRHRPRGSPASAAPPAAPPVANDPTAWPTVTVQLPLYNEDRVAARVIAATCRMTYPPGRWRVQVLDDSTDAAEDVRAACEREARRPDAPPIDYVHRAIRTGYKAGALAAGLCGDDAELVCVFDADFVPPADFLLDTIPAFHDEAIGCVQTRWEHLNRHAGALTEAQAIFLDGHFTIEHAARSRSGRFMHFNGTAGVWRRACIDDAGGWSHDTLTEDLDLSYRAQLRGWRFVYLPEVAAPAELPPEMLAFKQQAHRWTKGSVQTARKLLGRVLKHPTLPMSVKSEAFFHLTCTVVYPLMVLLTIVLYPAFLSAHGLMHRHPFLSFAMGATVFLVASCGAGTFFVYAQRELHGRAAAWRALGRMPFVMALGIGLSINNARAVLEGLFDRRESRNEFVRTPKYGDPALLPAALPPAAARRPRQSGRQVIRAAGSPYANAVTELACCAYLTAFIVEGMLGGFARGSVPFLTLFAFGYGYVGISTFVTSWRQGRDPLSSPPAVTRTNLAARPYPAVAATTDLQSCSMPS